MRRHRQKLEDLMDSLSEIESTWMDAHAETVLRLASKIRRKPAFQIEDLRRILDTDFKAGLTFIRLVLSLSKDKFEPALKDALGAGNTGSKRYESKPEEFLIGLEKLGILGALGDLVNTPVSWKDILAERLKHMRGSAVSGQTRGRSLEDFTERL